MIPDETLVKLIPDLSSRYRVAAGWLFPDGSVVPCDILRHRDVLPQELRDRYDEMLADYHVMMDEDLDSLDPDEHPALHRFDPEGHTTSDHLREISRLGYMRIGVMSDYRDNSLVLEVNGNKESLKRHHDVISYIVAGLDIREVWFTDYESYSFSRKRQKQFT